MVSRLHPEPALSDRPHLDAAQATEAEVALLLDVVRQTDRELHKDRASPVPVTLDTSLDRDLGLDSLARVELLLRIEHAFGVALPENALQLATTPRDLLAAVRAGEPKAARPAQPPRALVEPAMPEVSQPTQACTLTDVLDWHARRHGQRTHIVMLSAGEETRIGYAALQAGAASVAAALRQQGLRPREAVAIMLPTSLEYFHAFLGILLAGGIPVPIYPPTRISQIEEHVRRHAGILANAQAAMMITVPETMAAARLLEAQVPSLRRILPAVELLERGEKADPAPISPSDIAFIQYTSGSTGDPKGVVLTHANLLANIRAMVSAIRAGSADVFVSWLPLYHDMGLIGAWLGSLYAGCPLVVMSPLAFLSQPQRWLWAIHRYRGTLTAAPNFAFELCLSRIASGDIDGLDLSSLRFLANGSEMVSADTVERFVARFSAYGLKPTALSPVFGLAECAVGLLFPPLDRGPVIDRVAREPFMRHGEALPADVGDASALRFVGCGAPLPGHAVRIVDEIGRERGERIEGRLEFRGPSATSGYYRNAGQTRNLIQDGWLDTGDKAYRAGADVYITGRIKDLIIRAGRNIHPHELEEAVALLPGVRKGCVAVFGTADPRLGTERLVVLAETRERRPAARQALHDAISRLAVELLGEPADEIVLAPPHTVLKTSSGKLRRSATRALYEAGLVGARSPAAWLEAARLLSGAALPGLRRRLKLARQWVHGCHAATVFALGAVPAWLITALLPWPERAWKFNRFVARLVFRLSGTPLLVQGAKNLPGSTHVIVCNHASYLDGMILVAALPQQHTFVAKRELRDRFVARVHLRHLGAEFVERFAAQQSLEDANRLADAAVQGRSLAFFPEGTFANVPGLLPFHLGAFVIAARSNVPVVPIAIRGSRSLLPGDRWFPHPGPLVVTIGAPISPAADAPDAFAAAVKMRDLARAEIAQHCGEADAVPVR